jgi:hypothetical protein
MAPLRKYDMMAHLDIEKARRQARLNKQRADRMERDIAAYLNRGRQLLARRTPQSGAGWIKGDDHVPLATPPDFFMISCKMTQAQNEKGESVMKFSAKWITELERDVKSMKTIGCKFGIMVLRWFGRAKGEYFALINLSEVEIVERYLNIKLQFNGKVIDKSVKKNGAPLVISTITRTQLMENYYTTFKFGYHELLLVPLSDIHEALLKADALLGE